MNYESAGSHQRKRAMKKSISFATDLFETIRSAGQDKHVGEDLANWLVGNARDSEFRFGQPEKTDRGWTIPVTADDESFVVGIDDHSVGDKEAEWAITVEKSRKWKMFGQQDSAMRAELCDLIHNMLRSEPQISEVRWSD